MSETHFQNTETALKNQQASIQGLETLIGQLSKLISKLPQGSLPYEEKFIEPKLEPKQETVVSRDQDEVNSHSVWEMKQSPFKLAILATHRKLKEMSLNEAHESFSSSNRGSVHEDQRTHDKPKLRQNELNTFPHQLKVGEKVLLDAANPHIVTTTLNEEIPLTVLSIFPFSTVEVSYPKFGTFKGVGLYTRAWEKRTKPGTVVRHGRVHPHFQGTRAWTKCSDAPKFKIRELHGKKLGNTGVLHGRTMSSSGGKKAAVHASKKRKGALSSSGPTVNVHHPFLRFPIGPQEELFQILRARPLIAGRCIDWAAVEQVQLADAIRALLTTNPWELFFGIIKPTYLELTMELCSTFHLQTMITNYDDPDTCISYGHVIDLAYFIALTIQHQAEWHRKGVISIGPYVTRLARHLGLLSTTAQESSLILIGQMSAQGISSMLSMRMIEAPRNLPSSMAPKLIITLELKTPPGKVLHDCHVLLDHDHATTRYNILLEQDLQTNEPLPLPEYPPPPSLRLFSDTPVQGNSFSTQEVSLLSLSYFDILFYTSIFVH
ncbi:hypothetical protein GOBAR_AA25084 [Gossypium barbadense]|uniref:Uncharacterized protein n=1 Tax=Gossypium barbadense TaxID=3634 RepID=A0A2P5WWX8_GOSBA|nr:hypothetical protein GOBAR_AA25084 [Gossypium barbadense]